MSCRGIFKKLERCLGFLTTKERETFLDLVTTEESKLLGLDFLNCILLSRNIKPIPDKCIKYLPKFDIIKTYSPGKTRITK